MRFSTIITVGLILLIGLTACKRDSTSIEPPDDDFFDVVYPKKWGQFQPSADQLTFYANIGQVSWELVEIDGVWYSILQNGKYLEDRVDYTVSLFDSEDEFEQAKQRALQVIHREGDAPFIRATMMYLRN